MRLNKLQQLNYNIQLLKSTQGSKSGLELHRAEALQAPFLNRTDSK